MITRLGVRRRAPISRDRYRAVARGAGMPRPARRRALDFSLVVIVAIATVAALPRVAGGVGVGIEQLVASVQSSIPLLQGRGDLQLPAGGSTSIGAAPVVDALPSYTREPQLQLSGRVPSFAVQPDRSLQIVVNGAVVKTDPLDPSGAFNATLALKDGPNAISVTLIGGRDVVAASTYTVVLDRIPPTVTISRPSAGDVLDTKGFVVEGSTEAGAAVTVNGHAVVPSPEGAFSDSIQTGAGPLTITVVSRDRAGNETTQKLEVVVSQTTSAAEPTLTVALNKTSVRVGQQVVAAIYLRDALGPKVGVRVTLSVGVVTIGSAITDTTGTARIGFAAPTTEGDISVVVLGGSASGRATLTVTR